MAVRACIVRVPREVSRALAFAVVFSSRVSGIHFIEVSFLRRIAIILYGLPYPWVVRDSCGNAFRNWSVLVAHAPRICCMFTQLEYPLQWYTVR